MSFTHGNRPEDVVTDSKGNTLSGVTNTFYATEADANARTSPLGTATTTDGVWSFTSDLPLIWARTPAGKVYPVTSAEAMTADFTDQVNAARDSAATSAAAAQAAAELVNAPADTAVATIVGNPASATATALNAIYAAQSATLDARFMSPIGDPWDGTAIAAAVGAERARIANLFKAANTGTQVALGRRGNDYDLWQDLGGGIWWRIALAYDSTAGEEHHSLWQSVVGTLVASLDQTDASWALTVPGAGWATSSNVNAFGGSYARNDSTGATATWTSPAGATLLGLRAFRSTNGGYSKVSIDGDATKANRLPTAQQEVDAGRLASTALVANGGTLNPTDRLYDCYVPTTAGLDEFITFADGLTAGSHTLALVNTGYKETASSSTRLYVSGGFYAAATNTPATAGASLSPLVTLLNSSSVYEYAVTYTPQGGTQTPFIGNRHGNEIEDALTFRVDGATVAPADGTVTVGTSVEVTRTTHLRHPDTGATDVATGTCVYTMTPADGLDVHWTLDWLVAGTARTSYAGMLPIQSNTFAKGRAANGPVVALLSDDGTVKGSTRSDTVALWQDGGQGAAMMTARNLPAAVNRWAGATTDFAWLQDRTAGDFNKGYFQRVQAGSTEAITVGAVWESYIRFRAAWMTSTAALAA